MKSDQKWNLIFNNKQFQQKKSMQYIHQFQKKQLIIFIQLEAFVKQK